MSKETEEYDRLIEEARKLGPMSDEERREQAASFAFGQLALTRRYRNADEDTLAELRRRCREAAGIFETDG